MTEKKTTEDIVEKKARSTLTPYEWRVLRKKIALKENINSFNREFRKQMKVFITGAFSFVAALLWKDAISSFLEKYQTLIEDSLPITEIWMTEMITAFIVSVVAIVGIITVSRMLKTD